MKNLKSCLWVLVVLLPTALRAQTGNDFTLTGKVGSFNAPAKVYLGYVADEKIYRDSAVLKDGAFTITGHAPAAPVRAVLVLNKEGDGDGRGKGDSFVSFYVEKGNMILTNAPDSLTTAIVSGTPTNEDLIAFRKSEAQVRALITTRAEKVKLAGAAQKEDPAFKAELAAIEKKTGQLANRLMLDFVKSHQQSYLSLAHLERLSYVMDYTEVAPLFEALSEDVRSCPQGRALTTKLARMKTVALGATAPEIVLPDTAGKIFHLSSMRGNYVLVDFWASWCGPCRAENPNVLAAFNKYRGKNFTVLGVSLDQPGGKSRWTAAILKDGLPWTQVSDLKGWKCEAAAAYAVTAIPQNYLLDPEGKIIAKNLRGDSLNQKLAELLE